RGRTGTTPASSTARQAVGKACRCQYSFSESPCSLGAAYSNQVVLEPIQSARTARPAIHQEASLALASLQEAGRVSGRKVRAHQAKNASAASRLCGDITSHRAARAIPLPGGRVGGGMPWWPKAG